MCVSLCSLLAATLDKVTAKQTDDLSRIYRYIKKNKYRTKGRKHSRSNWSYITAEEGYSGVVLMGSMLKLLTFNTFLSVQKKRTNNEAIKSCL